MIRIEATLELLTELHQAHEALQRSRVKRKESPALPQLEKLMVQVAGARMRITPVLEPTRGEPAG
jgi:hypothetical protein